MSARRFLILTVCLLGVAAPARAQGFITPFVGYNYGGDSDDCAGFQACNSRRLNFGVSIGKTGGMFGVEEDIGYASQFFGTTAGGNNAVLTAMSNLLLVIPAGPIQPYGLFGFGLVHAHAQLDSSLISLNKNSLGYDIGGGVNIFFGKKVGIRGDIRRMKTFDSFTLGIFGNDQLNFWRASAGITIRY